MKSHYTYKLIALNPLDERVEYIGVRSCSGLPADDTAYMSSSREIRALIKSGVQFVKEIIAVHESRKKAVAHEVELHDHHDVARSPRFFNKAKQTSTGWDTGGTTSPRQSDFMSTLWQDDNFKSRWSASARARRNTPEFRELRSHLAKEFHARPGHREKMSAAMTIALNKPDTVAKMSSRATQSWADPKFHAKMSASRRVTHTTDEFRRKQSDNSIRQMSSPVARKLASQNAKQSASLRNQYCAEMGITQPGKGFCNIDKADFQRWLAANNKEAA